MPRSNLQIKVGTYTGNGVDSTNITGVGFRPDLVIVKGGANIACWRNKHNRGDSTMYLAGNTANFADGIQEILSDGFQVGTDAKVNANGTTYYYIAIRGTSGQSHFKTGRYYGNATDARQLTAQGIDFTPDIFFVKGNRADNPSVKTTESTGDNSWHFSGSIDAANEIQDLIANGVELGTSSRVNGATTEEYFFAALKKLSGAIQSFTYTGNGVDGREITGLGFQPDFVIVKNATATNAACIRTSDFSGDSSASVGASTATTNQIQSFTSDGFTVGTSAPVNTDATVYWGFAFKAGDFNAPITRTTA